MLKTPPVWPADGPHRKPLEWTHGFEALSRYYTAITDHVLAPTCLDGAAVGIAIWEYP